jgi:hypothetical protein
VKRGNPNTGDEPRWPRFRPATGGLTLSLRSGSDGHTQVITDARYSAVHHCGFWDSISAY